MRNVTVAAIQMSIPETPEKSVEKAEKLVRKAAAEGANVILLPELFENWYFCQERRYDSYKLALPLEENPAVRRFQTVAKELSVVLPISFYEQDGNVLYNSVAMIDADGSVMGVYRKTHIPDDHFYQEKFYFTPGDLGYKAFDTKFGRIGVLICWDQWYPEAARLTAMQGAEIIFYPTAIGWLPEEKPLLGEQQHCAWETVQRGHAVANGCYVCAVNRVGTEGESEFWGQSFVADYYGQIVAKAPVSDEAILYADLDLDALEDHRRIWPFFRDRRIDSYGGITERWGR